MESQKKVIQKKSRSDRLIILYSTTETNQPVADIDIDDNDDDDNDDNDDILVVNLLLFCYEIGDGELYKRFLIKTGKSFSSENRSTNKK